MSGEAGISAVDEDERLPSPSGLGPTANAAEKATQRNTGPTANAAENATQRNTGPTANTTENATQRNSGPPAAAAENAPRNTCWPTPTGPALNVISRTTDLPILSRSSYEQYDRIVVLREPKHALVPSGVRLSANEYAVGVGESVLKFYR